MCLGSCKNRNESVHTYVGSECQGERADEGLYGSGADGCSCRECEDHSSGVDAIEAETEEGQEKRETPWLGFIFSFVIFQGMISCVLCSLENFCC